MSVIDVNFILFLRPIGSRNFGEKITLMLSRLVTKIKVGEMLSSLFATLKITKQNKKLTR